jgi:hypothetical protein
MKGVGIPEKEKPRSRCGAGGLGIPVKGSAGNDALSSVGEVDFQSVLASHR